MEEKSGIFLLDGFERSIVHALQEVLEVIMPGIMEDNRLDQRIGYGQFRWNPIITHLRDACDFAGWMDFGLCKRGAFPVPVLFHPQTRKLITLMTEDRLSDMQRQKTKGKHYLCAASAFNIDVTPQEEQLMMDLPPANADYKWIATSQDQLCASVGISKEEITGHVLVIFNCKYEELTSVCAARLTANLEISTEEESWSKFLKQPFSATTTPILPEHMEDDAEEQLVDFK